MFLKRCPSIAKIESHLRAPSPSGRTARHIQACPNCQKLASELTRDATLLAELREAIRPEGDHPPRTR